MIDIEALARKACIDVDAYMLLGCEGRREAMERFAKLIAARCVEICAQVGEDMQYQYGTDAICEARIRKEFDLTEGAENGS
jgi:hypothetical protein